MSKKTNNLTTSECLSMLPDGIEPSRRQCELSMEAALDACERYYQAFQFVVWAGKSAREAIDSAMFETAGEA